MINLKIDVYLIMQGLGNNILKAADIQETGFTQSNISIETKLKYL